MKTLQLHEMENLQGGDINDAVNCGGAALGIAAAVFAVAAISGPIGWMVYAGGIAGGLATGASAGACVYGLVN